MIVRNEERILRRCLDSVAAHVAGWVICDTGSSDGTPHLVEEFFRARGIPGELHRFPFDNFERARNRALDLARGSGLDFDYVLLTDADMELNVTEPDFRDRLGAPGYKALQRSGFTYWNVRLVRRDVEARYVGVTHEYLDVPGGADRLHGLWFADHAEGANRTEKYVRDIALLEDDVRRHPNNARSWFYLAQSYCDTSRWGDAIAAYRRRIALGGWAEETWYARLKLARCLLRQDEEASFLQEALGAWSARPHRAEPLHELARYHRLRGEHAPASLFASTGLNLSWPKDDSLFVENAVYSHGLAEEFSISGYYEPQHRERAGRVCNALAVRPGIPVPVRSLARSNLRHYASDLAADVPSFRAAEVAFVPPDGYRAMNPSVFLWNEAAWLLQRAVNYELTAKGDYVTFDGGPVRTRNFLLRLDAALGVEQGGEIQEPVDLPPPRNGRVLGFEDVRPFVLDGVPWATATCRQLNPEGWCETVLARIDVSSPATPRFAQWRTLRPDRPRQHEKNWMPAPSGKTTRLVYSVHPTRILDLTGTELSCHPSPFAADQVRGGSQAVPFGLGWLAVCHEHVAVGRARTYLHRFVWIDRAGRLRRMSRAFILQKKGVEFVCGLAWHPDGKQLLISFGIGDGQSWLGACAGAEVARLLQRPEQMQRC